MVNLIMRPTSQLFSSLTLVSHVLSPPSDRGSGRNREKGRGKRRLKKNARKVCCWVLSILYLIPFFPPSYSKGKVIYYHYYKEWTDAISISDFWASDMVFSLKTKKTIC